MRSHWFIFALISVALGDWPQKIFIRLRHNSPRLQTILQSYNNQDSVVLVQKQTYGPMDENREPRNKPRHLWSTNLWQRRHAHKMGERQSFQQVLLGNLDSCMQIIETRTHLYAMPENKLKMAERLKYKTRHHQTPEENIGKTFSDINLTNVFSG